MPETTGRALEQDKRVERMVHAGDGAYLWAEAGGDGAPPLLLLHGGPGLWDDLGPLASVVEDRHRVVRFDQRGNGRSSRVGPYTVERTLADVESVRAAYDLSQVVIGGHSFGASLALVYALRHPDHVRAVVYISGTGIGRSWHARYVDERMRRLPGRFGERYQQLKAFERRTAEEERELSVLSWAPDFANRRDSMQLARGLLHPEFVAEREVNRALTADAVTSFNQRALKRELRELQVPVLVLHGEDDPRPANALDTMVKSLPDAELHVLPGVGHYPWLERPWLMGRALREFLARV